jgi:acyl-CoA reductase-like NAD-dependent aldehyde dehydrogenase
VRLTVEDPATGGTVGEVVAASSDQVREAVAAAHAAYPAWSALSPDERAAPLRRAYELVVEHAGELARALTLEGGKPVDEAEGEVRWGAEFLLWYAEEIRRPRLGGRRRCAMRHRCRGPTRRGRSVQG